MITVMAAGEEDEAGNNLALERRKTVLTGRSQVAISSRSGGRIFFSIGPWSTFCADSCFYFGIFHPGVTAAACKRSQSFCPKCRRQSVGTIGNWIQSACSADSLTVSVQPRRAVACIRINNPQNWQSCRCLDPKVPCTLILVIGMASAALVAATPCPGKVTQISRKGQRSTEKEKERVNE